MYKRQEQLAVREARRLGMPIIALVDTNCDPDEADYVVPGNDDAIRSCTVVARAIGDVVAEGQSVFRAEEERARQEADERARLEAEERARVDTRRKELTDDPRAQELQHLLGNTGGAGEAADTP